MCGILGAYSGAQPLGSPPFTARDLDRMTHRGPDGQGWYVAPNALMGFRRLAIIDLAGGAQPLFSEDEQVVLTINGEIYNHRQIRENLRHFHTFRSRVDGEVLVHLYEDLGLHFLDFVNGMFAFALYDRRTDRIVLGRDRGGQKPLYYMQVNGELRWASEMKVLLQGRRPTVNREALHDYLRFGYVPAPLTILDGVFKLPAGHLLVADASTPILQPNLQPYWKLVYERDDRVDLPSGEADEWARALRDEFDKAVRLRLESEVPMGFLLSGGVDSAAVFAAGALSLGERTPTAFTISFMDTPIDEAHVAREVAGLYKAKHVVLGLHQNRASALEEVAGKIEEPVSTDALLPTNEVFASIAEATITTVLSGEGSDELFAGYRKFRHVAPWNPERLRPFTSPLERYLAEEEFVFRDAGDRRALLGGEPPESRRFDVIDQEAEALDPLSQMLLIEHRMRLPDRINLRLDRLSMAYSIEARAPFMDYAFMQFCASIPNCLKTRQDTDKWVLRNAMRQRLPASVLDARKAPFHAPAHWHTSGDVGTGVLGDASIHEAGLVDPDTVRRLRSGADRGDRETHEKLFSLYVLHAWYWSFCHPGKLTPTGDTP